MLPSFPLARVALAAVTAVAALAASGAHAAGWTAVRLMGEHQDYLFPNALNDAGVAVGRTDGRELHPTDARGALRSLGSPVTTFVADGQRLTEATAIARDGAIAGNAGVGPYDVNEAFLRTTDGQIQLLFPKGTLSYAFGVNASHQVVGYVQQSDGTQTGYVWQGGTVTWLGGIGGKGSVASAINDAGTVVGVSETATPYQYHAFRWQAGVTTDLGTLPDDFEDASSAEAINASGLVVGYCGLGNMRPCAWGADGQAHDLGLLAGHYGGIARAVNDLGVAVGSSIDSQRQQRAMIFHDGLVEDLNTRVSDLPAGVTLTEGVAINRDGAILVHASQGRFHKPCQYVLIPK